MRILILSPHPDDAELCMGGTISRLKREGNFIKVISFSKCDNNRLYGEFTTSMMGLGVDMQTIIDFPRRKFKAHRQSILDVLIEDSGFDMVFSTPPYDCHQDHQTIGEEAIRAYGKSTLLFYINPNNVNQINTKVIYKLTKQDIDNKEKAIKCYKSQFEMKRNYFDLHYLRSVASVYGKMIGVDYAEAFDIYREIK